MRGREERREETDLKILLALKIKEGPTDQKCRRPLEAGKVKELSRKSQGILP